MRLFRQSAAALLVLTIPASSCNPQDQPGGTPFSGIEIHEKDGGKRVDYDSLATAAGVTALMKEKAADFRSAVVSDSTRNGVYVYSATVTSYGATPEKLAARIALMGFRDVYISPGSGAYSSGSTWLPRFIAACSATGTDVHALKLASTDCLSTPSAVTTDVGAVTSYNSRVKQNQRFAGLAADIEPHTAKSGVTVSGTRYVWNSSTGYGKGGDNDNLIRLTIERLSAAGSILHAGSLKLSEAYWYNYQIYCGEGQLDYGSADQFLAACDFLVTMAYFSNSATVWSKSEPVLKAASREKSVSICLKVKVNGTDSDSMQPQGWSYLLSACRTLRQKASAYKSFRGIDQFAWDGLEQMWSWTNDKN